MKIAFYGDSLTKGIPGLSYFQMLEERLPEHELMNYGKGGDTVISLYRRIERREIHGPVDIAFLWVGVNDVLAKVTFTHSMLKRLMRQPRAKDHIEIRDYYDRTLKLLRQKATHILTVSPLLIGEDLSNPWNRELAELREIVASASSCFSNVQYIDLRSSFSKELAGRTISGYVPNSILRIARDTFTLRSPAQVDTAASRRGLYLTLDGVHLNSAGAEIVTESFREMVRTLS